MQNGVIICTHTHTSSPDRSAMTDVGPVHSSVKFVRCRGHIVARQTVRVFAAYLPVCCERSVGNSPLTAHVKPVAGGGVQKSA